MLKHTIQLAFVFSISSMANPLLQLPGECSTEQVQERINKKTIDFTWRYPYALAFGCHYRDKQGSFAVRFAGIPLYSHNYSYYAAIKGVIARMSGSDTQVADQHQNRPYYFAPALACKDANPEIIDEARLASLLAAKKCVFYTGAGLSAASDVPTMPKLMEQLGMTQGRKAFLKKLWKEPGAVAHAFEEFCQKMLQAPPTPAHYAIKDMATYFKTQVLTENCDLLQHRTGIMPISMHSDFWDNVTPEHMKDIQGIICVGMSKDDCGFLGYYKQHNPGGFIAAVDIGKPVYLSDQDYLLPADVQTALPAIAKKILE